jgi:hypothetical protein
MRWKKKMNLLNSKIKRLIPITPKERTCRTERMIMQSKREWAKERIERALREDNGLVIPKVK